jgi:hypothetical protein
MEQSVNSPRVQSSSVAVYNGIVVSVLTNLSVIKLSASGALTITIRLRFICVLHDVEMDAR